MRLTFADLTNNSMITNTHCVWRVEGKAGFETEGRHHRLRAEAKIVETTAMPEFAGKSEFVEVTKNRHFKMPLT